MCWRAEPNTQESSTCRSSAPTCPPSCPSCCLIWSPMCPGPQRHWVSGGGALLAASLPLFMTSHTRPRRLRCCTLTAQVPGPGLHTDELPKIAARPSAPGEGGPSPSDPPVLSPCFLPETPLLPTQVLAQHHFWWLFPAWLLGCPLLTYPFSSDSQESCLML